MLGKLSIQQSTTNTTPVSTKDKGEVRLRGGHDQDAIRGEQEIREESGRNGILRGKNLCGQQRVPHDHFAIDTQSFIESKRVLFLNSFLKKGTKQYKGEIEKARTILNKYI